MSRLLDLVERQTLLIESITRKECLRLAQDHQALLKEMDAKSKRTAEIMAKIWPFLPAVVNKIAGKEIVRQKDSNLESVVTAFIETIDAKTLDRMSESGVFSQQQMILFATVLEAAAKRLITIDERVAADKKARAAAMNIGNEPS